MSTSVVNTWKYHVRGGGVQTGNRTRVGKRDIVTNKKRKTKRNKSFNQNLAKVFSSKDKFLLANQTSVYYSKRTTRDIAKTDCRKDTFFFFNHFSSVTQLIFYYSLFLSGILASSLMNLWYEEGYVVHQNDQLFMEYIQSNVTKSYHKNSSLSNQTRSVRYQNHF